jgi:hypothetical protein
LINLILEEFVSADEVMCMWFLYWVKWDGTILDFVSRSKSLLCHFLVMWIWIIHLISLRFMWLFCELEMTQLLSRILLKIKSEYTYKELNNARQIMLLYLHPWLFNLFLFFSLTALTHIANLDVFLRKLIFCMILFHF